MYFKFRKVTNCCPHFMTKEHMLKFAQKIKQLGEVECLPTYVLCGNSHVREFVCHIIVGFSN
jgi:hypothetical protein